MRLVFGGTVLLIFLACIVETQNVIGNDRKLKANAQRENEIIQPLVMERKYFTEYLINKGQ